MHETKYAHHILGVLTNKVGQAALGTKTVTVRARLSPFSHVTPAMLAETFAALAAGEGFKDVRLRIEPIAYEIHCRRCGAVSTSAAVIHACPRCGSIDFDIEKEREFFVDAVEIEG